MHQQQQHFRPISLSHQLPGLPLQRRDGPVQAPEEGVLSFAALVVGVVRLGRGEADARQVAEEGVLGLDLQGGVVVEGQPALGGGRVGLVGVEKGGYRQKTNPDGAY